MDGEDRAPEENGKALTEYFAHLGQKNYTCGSDLAVLHRNSYRDIFVADQQRGDAVRC